MDLSVLEKLTDHINQVQAATEELSFNAYVDMVQEQPRLAQLSHARIYGMIKSAGVKESEEVKTYNFFEDEIFGIDDVLEDVVEYFHSSAKRLEIRKRILLLMGPPGSGKSTLVSKLKRGLEEFSLTEDGKSYSIKYPENLKTRLPTGEVIDSPNAGRLCPMREEPLHAIPHQLRNELKPYIEGDLCPLCRHVVDEELNGDFTRLLVRRVIVSEKRRCGIGVFQPTDTKSQDISDLVGAIDLSTVGDYGSESDPRAYRFDGEANVANRGMLEMVEMLKVDERFLYLLLTLSQEQSIKAGRFPLIYADETVIAHTNESEYRAWAADKKSEALKDRVIVLTCRYNLRVDDEVKIYKKLINQTSIINNVHIDPMALRAAATFAILTRLEEPQKAGFDIIKKLKLYNGETIIGVKDKDVKELKEQAIREGMDGIGPRYVINQLARALVKDGSKCMTTIDTLRSLKDGLESSPSNSRELKEKYNNFITEARKEYDEKSKIEIQKAFVHSFEEQANTLLKVYLDNVEAFCNKDKVKHPITGDDMEPDTNLMRSIEETIQVGETAAKAFREDILIRIAHYYRSGKAFEYNSHPRLKEAIEKKLFNDLKDIVRVTTSTKTPDKEQLEKINSVAQRLMDEHGYCEVCAHELLKYVGTLLNR